MCNSKEKRPKPPSTFQDHFFKENELKLIKVPDYQRAFAWEEEQIALFIKDLMKFHRSPEDYYFGHFICETSSETMEIVDGQQRISTFVIFLLVCSMLSKSSSHDAYDLISRFKTVSYDTDAFDKIIAKLNAGDLETVRKNPSDTELTDQFSLDPASFTTSQRLIVQTINQFNKAFSTKGSLEIELIPCYLDVILKSSCSLHQAKNKSVAANIFEMHNTRGVALSTLEIVKAKLMQFVYHYGGDKKDEHINTIQKNFGEIYKLEALLAEKSFRGKLNLEQLLRLHLRVIDDGNQTVEAEYKSPPMDNNSDTLITYIDNKLYGKIEGKQDEENGINYAIKLSKLFLRSVKLLSKFLPLWDKDEPLVGDVLILEKELSCQFFLLTCPVLETEGEDEIFDRLSSKTLKLWERLLFTRDLHNEYYKLTYKDNFPQLFWRLDHQDIEIEALLDEYLKDGFRADYRTQGLQKTVRDYITEQKVNILNNTYYWHWKQKMIYAIYKFEVSLGAKLRNTMKGTISIDHMLPQNWKWDWIAEEFKSSEEMQQKYINEVSSFINGLGNLIPITVSENSSLNNGHPADNVYSEIYIGGTYDTHNTTREADWRDATLWETTIRNRGEEIYRFMLENLIEPEPQD